MDCPNGIITLDKSYIIQLFFFSLLLQQCFDLLIGFEFACILNVNVSDESEGVGQHALPEFGNVDKFNALHVTKSVHFPLENGQCGQVYCVMECDIVSLFIVNALFFSSSPQNTLFPRIRVCKFFKSNPQSIQ